MRETFEHKLGKLNNDLIRMGGMIEEAIASAITALRDSDAGFLNFFKIFFLTS